MRKPATAKEEETSRRRGSDARWESEDNDYMGATGCWKQQNGGSRTQMTLTEVVSPKIADGNTIVTRVTVSDFVNCGSTGHGTTPYWYACNRFFGGFLLYDFDRLPCSVMPHRGTPVISEVSGY